MSIALGAAVIICVIFALFVVPSLVQNQRERVPEGTQQDYDELCALCPPVVENSQQLEAARAKIAGLNSRFGPNCPNGLPVLNSQQRQYFYDLRNAVTSFLDLNPRFRYDKEWHAARQMQIARIEELLAQCAVLVGEKQVQYEPALRRLSNVGRVKDNARVLIAGEESDGRVVSLLSAQMAEHMLDSCEHDLSRAIVQGERALRLLQAKADGGIRYERSVRDLLYAGANTDDFEQSELLLRQALAQSENPDADNEAHDFVRALQALALVLWRHRAKPEEAEALYQRVLAVLPADDCSDDAIETFEDVLRLYADMGELDSSMRYFELLLERLSKIAPAAYVSNMQHALAYLGDAHLRLGDVQKAEQCYRRALDLVGQYEKDRLCAFAMSGACECLIEFLCGQARYAEAVQLYDRLMSFHRPDDIYIRFRSPEKLRLYANMLKFVDRGAEAEGLLTQAEEQARKYAELADKPSPRWPENRLHFRLEQRMILSGNLMM